MTEYDKDKTGSSPEASSTSSLHEEAGTPIEETPQYEEMVDSANTKKSFKKAVGIVLAVVIIAGGFVWAFAPLPNVIEKTSDYFSLHDGSHYLYRSSSEALYRVETDTFDLAEDRSGDTLFVLKFSWRNAAHEDLAVDEALDIEVIQDGHVCKRVDDPKAAPFASEVDFKKAGDKIRPADRQTVYFAYEVEEGEQVDVLVSARVNEELFGEESSAILVVYEFDEAGHPVKVSGKELTRSSYIEATGAQI